jgi:hypothetical protein
MWTHRTLRALRLPLAAPSPADFVGDDSDSGGDDFFILGVIDSDALVGVGPGLRQAGASFGSLMKARYPVQPAVAGKERRRSRSSPHWVGKAVRPRADFLARLPCKM